MQEEKVPDTQFGFYPDRNTLHPMFILRHLVQAGKVRNSNKHVYAAFIDFKQQAYDKVDRMKLWNHLQTMGMPPQLLRIVQDMYAGDEHV